MKKQQTTSEKESRQKERTAELDVKFIDLKRDFAFKWTFGTEGHEELLLMLVDSLLPEKHIRKVSLGTQEQEPDREDAQGGIFDIYCETDDGSSLTIEMQVCPKKDFNDRMVFYSSFPIRNRVGQGAVLDYRLSMKDSEIREKHLSSVRYKLPPIYVIGIVDFELFGLGKSDRIIRHFSIREDEGDKDKFTDSIHYVTVELPKFHKSKAELKSKQDYMLYAITNMKEMEEIPEEFLGKGFDKLFEVCRFASMSEDMQMNYVRHMMAKWDREDELATAIMDGEAKGIAKGRAEGEAIGKAQTAKAMKNKDMDPALISELTGLTLEQIQAL
ncbi:MAG: PD-(D/E)XK nuclease family transposase [Bacteroidaceae bacterium]|nr:PD-(D/E)XK nuclease family transposase [Bacteroidaceae bacterium]